MANPTFRIEFKYHPIVVDGIRRVAWLDPAAETLLVDLTAPPTLLAEAAFDAGFVMAGRVHHFIPLHEFPRIAEITADDADLPLAESA